MDLILTARSGFCPSCKQDRPHLQGPVAELETHSLVSLSEQSLHPSAETFINFKSALTSLQILFSSRWVWGFLFFFNLICIKGISHLGFLRPVPRSHRKFLPFLFGLHVAKAARINYIPPQSQLTASERPLLTENAESQPGSNCCYANILMGTN